MRERGYRSSPRSASIREISLISCKSALPLSRFSGSPERVDPPDGTARPAATPSEEPAGEPAPAAERDGVESRVASDDERDASVMLGPPSEASRSGCAHCVDFALRWLAAGRRRRFLRRADGGTFPRGGNSSSGRTEGGAGERGFLAAEERSSGVVIGRVYRARKKRGFCARRRRELTGMLRPRAPEEQRYGSRARARFSRDDRALSVNFYFAHLILILVLDKCETLETRPLCGARKKWTF